MRFCLLQAVQKCFADSAALGLAKGLPVVKVKKIGNSFLRTHIGLAEAKATSENADDRKPGTYLGHRPGDGSGVESSGHQSLPRRSDIAIACRHKKGKQHRCPFIFKFGLDIVALDPCLGEQ